MSIRVTVWNENVHEQKDPKIRQVYPNGIHGALAELFGNAGDISVRTATLDMPEHGLSDAVLEDTDVLVWWGHLAHEQVSDDVVDRVQRHVLQGMGLIVLHSGHMSKVFTRLMGTSCTLDWRDDDRERVWCCMPSHPIAEGVPLSFDIAEEEMYCEPFDVPQPDELVYIGWFQGGEVFRSGCCYHRGYGKVFYFQPGHEAYPTYRTHPSVRRILVNAVRWATPIRRRGPLECRRVELAESGVTRI